MTKGRNHVLKIACFAQLVRKQSGSRRSVARMFGSEVRVFPL